MTKKDYMAIAGVIRDGLSQSYCLGYAEAVEHIAWELADVCANSSGNFDRAGFFFACGMREV